MTLKKIALIMFACLLFVLTGCDEESKTSQPQDPDTPTKGEVECSNCGSKQPQDKAFCSDCGTELK